MLTTVLAGLVDVTAETRPLNLIAIYVFCNWASLNLHASTTLQQIYKVHANLDIRELVTMPISGSGMRKCAAHYNGVLHPPTDIAKLINKK